MFSTLKQLIQGKKNFKYPKIEKPNHTGYNRLIEDHINKLRASLKDYTSPLPPIMVDLNNLTWRIQLENQTELLMQLGQYDNNWQIIYADTQLLYLTLLTLALKPMSMQSNIHYVGKLRDDLKKDDYYSSVTKDILDDKKLFVPMITNDLSENGEINLYFNRGIEQTIWLIVSYAQSFPILVNKEYAQALNITIGLTDKPLAIDELSIV